MLRGKKYEASIVARENSHLHIVAQPFKSFQCRARGGVEEDCVQFVGASAIRIFAPLQAGVRFLRHKCFGHEVVVQKIDGVERSEPSLPLKQVIFRGITHRMKI